MFVPFFYRTLLAMLMSSRTHHQSQCPVIFLESCTRSIYTQAKATKGLKSMRHEPWHLEFLESLLHFLSVLHIFFLLSYLSIIGTYYVQCLVCLVFLSLISIFLGITNLLPLPALDGGRIVFVVIEMIRGKPISRRIETRIHHIGFALLLGLGVIIIIYDILKPVSL